MSDSGSPPRRKRSRERDEPSRRRARSRDRKRHRSRSPSIDRAETHSRRARSPREERHRWNDHDRNGSHRERRYDASDDDRGEHRRWRRNRSEDEPRSRRHRSRSRDGANGHGRHDEDKQLIRTRHHQDSSQDRHRHRRHSTSRSPPRKSHRKRSQSPPRRARGPLPSQQDAFTSNRNPGTGEVGGPIEKQKPNYGTSGKLAAETNTVSIGGEAIILKYHEPPEARKPPSSQAWRMYEFKGENADPLSTTELATRSCWLFGRETAVVDFLIEHPSCSKQHAVIQFRYVEKRSEFGDKIGAVKPYVLDLESANGVKVNGERIPDRRYIELKSGDSISFGESTRDYVVLLPPKEKAAAQS